MSHPVAIPDSAISLLTAEFLTPAQAASLLKVSRWELASMRLKRQGPPFLLRRRGVVVYPAESFISFLRARPQKDRRGGFDRRELRWSRTALAANSERRENSTCQAGQF
jgi:hypothetical protein